MSFLRYDTFCQYLAIVEQSIDVNKYSVEHIHVWPILRTVLCSFLQDDVESLRYKEKDSKLQSTLDKITNSIHHRFESIRPSIDLTYQIDISLLNKQSEGVVDAKSAGKKTVLFIGRTDDYTIKLESGWYAPILDSWYETAQHDYAVLKAEIFEGQEAGQAALNLSPRSISSALIDPFFSSATPKDVFLLDALKEKLSLLIQAVSKFSSEKLGINMKPEPIKEQAESILFSAMSVRNGLKPFLTGLGVNTIMMGCSYHYIGYGVHWAAAELSITGVELQHGGIGNHHFGYTHYTSVPRSGYILLPKVVNLWGVESAKCILRWLPQNHQYHQVVIGGKTIVTEKMLDHHFLPKFQELKQKVCHYQKIVLVSLQNRDYVSLTENLIIAIKESPQNWLWLIRCHPLTRRIARAGHDPLRVQQILTGYGIDNFEVNNSTLLPLDIVLAVSDHHVTHFSSVYLEATAHGVPTTFINLTAKSMFENQIETEVANLAIAPQKIIESISNFTPETVFDGPDNHEINIDEGWRNKVLESIVQ